LLGGDFRLSPEDASLGARLLQTGARARIISRSNSAKDQSICVSMRPAGPDVSIDSVKDQNFVSRRRR
jgi:hypothetical protein